MDLVHERRYIRVAGFLVEYDLIYDPFGKLDMTDQSNPDQTLSLAAGIDRVARMPLAADIGIRRAGWGPRPPARGPCVVRL